MRRGFCTPFWRSDCLGLSGWCAYLTEQCARISTLLNEKSTGENARLEQWTPEGYRVRKLKIRNRYLKLIDRINHALERIKDETYGYCEETGEEIGICTFRPSLPLPFALEFNRDESIRKGTGESETLHDSPSE